MFERLLRVLRGDKRDYAPTASISLEFKLSEILVIFLRLRRGDKRDYAPLSLI